MKILLFNLGPIGTRINAWGTEGFKSILEQDVILWGPIPDEFFYYQGKEIPIVRISEEISIKTVFERLPENWIPDIVTCDTSVLNYIPDIYLCPVKTILFTRDAWADTIYNRSLVELFDFIDYGIIDRSFYDRFQVRILPLSNCAVSLPDTDTIPPEFRERDIDVISIANCNSGFYHERYKTLYKLSDSINPGLEIKYVAGISRQEINSYYQRSKIVIDWAHTLSNRSYEAALNGCLLFSHEGNPVIKQFWIPWEEYIPYNENNVNELIIYYLNNPHLSEKIVKKAYEKVRSIPSSMGESYWEKIRFVYDSTVNVEERIKRVETVPKINLYHCLATPFVYNYQYGTNYPANWRELYFIRIDAALTESSDEIDKISPLIEAARVAYLLGNAELSEKYLSELEYVLPEYAWIYYLRARNYLIKNCIDQALVFTQKAILCGLENPELLQKYILPLVERNNSGDGRRVADFLWQPVYRHDNEYQVKSLLQYSYELSGDIFHLKGQINDAIDAYSKAVSYNPIPECIYKISRLLVNSENYEKLYESADIGLADSPYDSILVLYKAFSLLKTRQKSKAIQLLKKHKSTLKRFSGVRKIVFIKHSIELMLILNFMGRFFISKAIILVIGILLRKQQNDQ